MLLLMLLTFCLQCSSDIIVDVVHIINCGDTHCGTCTLGNKATKQKAYYSHYSYNNHGPNEEITITSPLHDFIKVLM